MRIEGQQDGGAASEGATEADSPGRRRGRVSAQGRAGRNRSRSDEHVREDLYGRLRRELAAHSRDVVVSVSNGLVTLSGTVADRHTKYRIEDLAEFCPGVRDVDNRIHVNFPAGIQAG
jgi:osmotically-inducible protein OsmY